MNFIYLLILATLFSDLGQTGEWDRQNSIPTPSPPPTPMPSPTPRMISMELYFQRAAKIIPIHGKEEEFEIVQEVPWLTEKDIAYVSPPVDEQPISLDLYLTPNGNQQYREAMMGNVGRTVILTLDGTSRFTSKMVPVARKNRIRVLGDFTFEEATRFADQINNRPAPSPTPAPTPSPPRRQKFIIN